MAWLEVTQAYVTVHLRDALSEGKDYGGKNNLV